MLPNINLDTETFDEITEAARNSIVGIFPEWTNFNASDPGMTMLEMFAWIKESRQYYLNKIGTANILKYLKLLGISKHHKSAARADVTIRCGEDLVIPSGAKFYAGGICFETTNRTYIPSAKIICCIARYGEEKRVINSRELGFGGNLGLKPFDKTEPENGEFRIGFDKPLPVGETVDFYINTGNDGGIPRNPITDKENFIPLVCMKAEYYGKNGRAEAEITDDTSFGFLTSGKISIVIPGEMRAVTFEETEAYWIRFKITGGEYDTQPIIDCIDFNFAELRQRDTKSEIHDFAPSESYTVTTELAALGNTTIFVRGFDGNFTCVDNYEREVSEDGSVIYSGIKNNGGDLVRIVNTAPDFFQKSIIGIGTGLPFQEYDLECLDIEYDSFRIMTELPDIDNNDHKKYIEWTKVPDFAGSKPDDLHFVFESDTGKVKFGSCTHGAAPEGMIMIIGYAVTAGSGGNVSANKINRLGTTNSDIIKVNNKRPAYGGSDEESIDDCQKRIHKILNSTETIVTAEDIEKRIMKTEGLRIENCLVIAPNAKNDNNNTLITAVVQPYSADGRGILSERGKENVLRQIERFRMLGTRIDVISPQYTDIGVYADIGISFKSSNARADIESAVREYFGRIRNSFGSTVSYAELFGLIDSLDCVVSVNTLTVDVIKNSGGAKKNGDGDIALSSGAAAVLTEMELVLHMV